MEDSIVKGPVGLQFRSFEEASSFYMDYNFNGWEKNAQTYVIPPVYTIHAKGVSHENSRNFVPFKKNIERADYQGQLAEEKILRAFVDYGYKSSQPMFVFHNFDFKDLTHFGQNKVRLQMAMNQVQKETDLIIVHRKLGILLVEIKSMKKFSSRTYSSAKEELNRAVIQLTSNLYFELSSDHLIKKIIACPFLDGQPNCKPGYEYIDLRQNHLRNFDRWWTDVFMETSDEVASLCSTIYYILVPKLLCGRGDICVCLNIAETAKELINQESVQDLYQKTEMESEVVKVSCAANVSDTIASKKEWLYFTPEQCEVWKKQKQVICGPYGCGKTLLLQSKATAFAISGEDVLVVVPSHLLVMYKNYFQNNHVDKKDNLKLISKREFYAEFEHYIKIAQSSHLFVDESLWLYEDEVDDDTSSSSSENSFEGLVNFENSILHQSEFNWSISSVQNSPNHDFEIIGVHNFEYWPENTDYSVLETEQKYIIDDPKNSDSELSYEGLCNFEQWMYHSASEASLSSEISSEPEVKMVKHLHELFNDENRIHFLWVVPHLYAIVRHKMFYDDLRNGAVYQFLKDFEGLPISTIRTTMRTSKQIHDFIIEKEWQEFTGAVDELEHLKHPAFHTVFHKFLGHSISGPSIKKIMYPSQCHHFGVKDKHPNQKITDHFHHFSAKVILTEINRLLQDPPAVQLQWKDSFETCGVKSKLPLQPRDIAIIGDSSEHPRLNLVLIKQLLEKTAQFNVGNVKYHQGGANTVAISYSCDIASLEWPVVIHVRLNKTIQLRHMKNPQRQALTMDFPFFEADHSVITSRCMVQYILICREDDSTEGFIEEFAINTDQGKIYDFDRLHNMDIFPTLIKDDPDDP